LARWDDVTIDAEEAFELTRQLVAIRSYPGEELAVQEFVAQWLRDAGLDAQLTAAGPDRPNVVVRLENGPGPTFLLNGHTDTVLASEAWGHDPWQGKREGDRFFALGAGDMKSGVAAMLIAARELDRHRDKWSGTVLVTAVVDEEAYSIGARALIDGGLQADYCLVTESSWDRPCLGAQGKYLVRVDVTGTAAHASWPELGVNAAEELSRFVARLHEVPMPTHPRIRASQTVLSFMSGSEKYVITVPNKATIQINRHTVPGERKESVIAAYQELVDDLNSPATFEFGFDPPTYPSWEIDADHPLVQAFGGAYKRETDIDPAYGYTGYGDMNLFSTEAGIPTVMFGPRAGEFHAANEWLDIPSIAGCSRVILDLVSEMLPIAR
jgi:acetylornithine deacetylase/succinyl-diaminopimelate desuccinylase-like protein